MSDSELIYELEADPPAAEKFFAALQHVLASFVGIITDINYWWRTWIS